MDQKTFRQRYKQLSSVEQHILTILAIAYEPVNLPNLQYLLRENDIRTEKGTIIQPEDLKEYRELLDAGGWLELWPENAMRIVPRYLELVMRMAVIDRRFRPFVRGLERLLPYRQWTTSIPRSYLAALRELRIGLYDGDLKKVTSILQDVRRFFPEEWKAGDFFSQFFLPFDPGWIATFPTDIQLLAIGELMRTAMRRLDPLQEYLNFLTLNGWFTAPEKLKSSAVTLCKNLLFQGKAATVLPMLDHLPAGSNRLILQGMTLFFQNQNSLSLRYYEEGLKLHKKENNLKKAMIFNTPGLFYLVALLKEKGKDHLKVVAELTQDLPPGLDLKAFAFLRSAVLYQLNYMKEAGTLLQARPETPLDWIIFSAACHWEDVPIHLPDLVELHRLQMRATSNGYDWLALEMASLLARLEPDETKYTSLAASLEKSLKTNSLLTIFQRTEGWERSLDALRHLQSRRSRKTALPDEKPTRLVWWVDFDNQEFQPVEQTFGKGSWSKGRNVALKRLKEGKVDNLNEQDREAIRAIRIIANGSYSGPEYYFDVEKLLPALVEHPLLFLAENPNVSVELLEKKPQLLVEENADGFQMKFSYDFKEAGLQLIRETPTRYLLLQVDDTQAEINRLLDFGRLQLPARAKEKVVEAVGNLSTLVTVQSEVGGEALNIPTVEGNTTIFVHLLPVGDGFKIEFFVKPFTTEPPYFKPGQGREAIIAEINGLPARATRQLKQETENARQVEDACPSLARLPGENREWLFEETEECLQVLLELDPLREAGEVVMEYPKGQKLRIAGQVTFDQVSMGIKKERDWFEVTGQVQVNEDLTLDFRRLLDLTQNSTSRFVQVSDGQFIALTSQLKRRLEELNSLFVKTKNDVRFHPLAAHAVEEFTGLLHELEVDAGWRKQIGRLREARQVMPKVPSTFKAELRHYQEEGFRWLSQMAHWGVGACLADDMGLGKTVQALALLLDRAMQGPALVVAPASVVRNWFHEAERFTPTLRPLIFGEGDRQAMLENLVPYDLLLCSYGLMQQEAELLTEKNFTTIVLDEAQAIKNRQTKRSQTAMLLQGDFKITTTGTPIENHLGELWNLFQFLNPGLLGSIDRFNDTYATPIERLQDRERRNQLRRLVQPFILRRRKNDVLEELPEKTEITLTVQLSDEERAFYEAIRRKALSNIENAGDFGQKRFQILAELMRLRQAACHPRLVSPESKVPSSKLQLLADTVEELLEGGHKALIFSQFVKHLKIVEEWVKSKGITYQYLDGSTPLPVRDRSIRAFQAGEGDLFLISLKAGGFGLNLTAADYVIHLDPWWNPAVEDQASDRAHRIGQLRPVTIYRLVTEDTVEEKIVQLHADKRDLADSLLEGTEVSGQLGAEALLALIKG